MRVFISGIMQAVAVVFMLQGGAWAADNLEPALLPAHGIYGLPAKGESLSHISQNFLEAIGTTTGEGVPTDAINWFNSEATRFFPASIIEKVTPQNKYRTYALSLQITRADEYTVDSSFNKTVDVYLPVAVNVFFTNILTGEVIYSISRTKYTIRTVSQEDHASGQYRDSIGKDYRNLLKELTTSALEQAAREFKPLRMTAKVVAEWKGYYILDKGMDGGVATGSELVSAGGAGLKVINAGRSYAVGIPSLGDIKEGDELSFFSTASAGDVKKPRVLILNAGTPENRFGAYATTQFAESLGSRASFTVVPVNPDFQAVLNDIAANQGLQQAEITQKRALPNYFLRLKILSPLVYFLPGSREYGRVQTFEVSGFAELIDQSGRVVYATNAQAEIKDTVIDGGKSFEQADRKKILYGNLLKALSDRFVENVRFSRAEISVVDVAGDRVTASDQAGLLATGQNVKVYQRLSSVKGVAEPVLIPVWEAQVNERQGNNITLTLVLPTLGSGKPVAVDKKNGVIVVDGAGSAVSGRLSFSLCDSVADIGTVHLPNKDDDLKDIAYFSLGETFKKPFFAGNHVVGANGKNLQGALSDFENVGFAKPVSVQDVASTVCMKPLLKIVETSRKCSESSQTCDFKLNVAAGVQVMKDGEKAATQALSVEYEIKNAPNLNPGDADNFEARKAFLKTIELMSKSISTIDTSQL